MDLAEGHLQALRVIEDQSGIDVWNLGTGTGYSMLELVHVFEQASGQTVPYKVEPRRAGDIAECWTGPEQGLKGAWLEGCSRAGCNDARHLHWSRNPQGMATPLREKEDPVARSN